MSTENSMTRRSFVAAGAGAAAAAVAAGAVTQAFADEADEADEAAEEETEEEDSVRSEERPEAGTGHPLGVGTVRAGAEPIEPVEPPASWDYEADVVVVGTGIGGLSALLYLAQNGMSVIGIEKESMTGGAGRHASNFHCNMGGSKLQQEFGYAWPLDEYDPDDDEQARYTAGAFMPHYQFTVDQQLMLRQVTEGPKWIDWFSEQDGISLVVADAGYYLIDEAIANGEHNLCVGNYDIVENLTADCEAAGAQIMLSTEATALVMEDGAVVGVVADAKDGEVYLKANTAVLLSAGGMGYNLDMLERYIPSAYMYAAQGGPLTSHTGEVIRMGVGAGADISGFNSYDCWDGGLDEYWGNGDGQWWHYFWGAGVNVIQNPWLCINEAGERIPFLFTDQDADPGSVTEGFYDDPVGNGDMDTISGLLSTVGHRGIRIFDSKYEESIYKFYDVYSQYKAYDGNRTPIPNPYDTRKTKPTGLFNDQDWQAEFQEYVDRGAISCCDTLEELEEALNLRSGVIVDAVERWNEICEAGVDTDLSTPYRSEYLIPIDTPPYYAAKVSSRLAKTACGVRVDPYNQVMREDGSLIDNLYACFTTAGGLGGENMVSGWGNYTISGSQAGSWVSGYNAAKAILG